MMPYCRQGIIAGMVLAFARALGEYGATSMLIGYIPRNTATISTTVYQLWRTNDEYSAFYGSSSISLLALSSCCVLLRLKRRPWKESGFMTMDVTIKNALVTFFWICHLRNWRSHGAFRCVGKRKSKTLQCIAGIETPDEGRIVINDKVLFDGQRHIDVAVQKRRVAYLFQHYALFPNMTCRENIACALHSMRDRKERRGALTESSMPCTCRRWHH